CGLHWAGESAATHNGAPSTESCDHDLVVVGAADAVLLQPPRTPPYRTRSRPVRAELRVVARRELLQREERRFQIRSCSAPTRDLRCMHRCEYRGPLRQCVDRVALDSKSGPPRVSMKPGAFLSHVSLVACRRPRQPVQLPRVVLEDARGGDVLPLLTHRLAECLAHGLPRVTEHHRSEPVAFGQTMTIA